MISLHSVLNPMYALIPTAFTAIAVMAIGIACVMGLVKGFRKVSWSGLVWLGAGVLFVFAGKSLGGAGTIVTLALAAGCVLASMTAFGILGRFVRPKVKWIKDEVNGDTSLAEYGLEFEPEYLDYDGENDLNPYGKMIHKTGCGKPSIIGRILGALTCGLNVAMILWAIASVALLAVDATSLKDMGFAVLLEGDKAQKLLESAKLYALDMLSLGVILAIAKKGYENGLLGSIRSFLVAIGGVVVIGVCFYLPFSPYAAVNEGFFHFLTRLVVRCTDMFAGFGGKFSPILARIFAGGVMALFGGVLLMLFNLLLAKCCNLVDAAGPTRLIDRCLATVLYLIIGAVVCVAIWAVLSTLNYFGVFNISEVLTDASNLSSKLLNAMSGYVEKLIAPIFKK